MPSPVANACSQRYSCVLQMWQSCTYGVVRTPNMIFKVNPDLADIVFFSTDSDAQDTLET